MKRIIKQKMFLKSLLLFGILTSDAAFSGKYVQCHENGTVSITQPLYPKYTGAQNFELRPRIVSKMMFDGNDVDAMPYQIFDPEDLVGPFETMPVESLANNSDEPFEIIDQGKIPTSPYSSCGRLMMTFPQKKLYYGSGAAIDRNLVITAAHNLLPINIFEHRNYDKVLAQEVQFEHMLLRTDPVVKNYQYSAKVSTHCFVHPKWVENFDPRYDIAFIFLSESLNLTQEQFDELLKLRIINEEDTEIRVIGYPRGEERMKESAGPVVKMENAGDGRAIDSKEIIYHLANTERGSSGSPIIATSKELKLGESDSNANHIIGIHAYGINANIPANSGVRLREELMQFLDDSIDSHQDTLTKSDRIAKFKAQKDQEEKEKQEQKLIDQAVEKAKQEMIINMIKNKISLNDIANIAQISVDEVQAIKNELENSKKRPREE
jgi:V8-like Glu-specific endopeptidase